MKHILYGALACFYAVVLGLMFRVLYFFFMWGWNLL